MKAVTLDSIVSVIRSRRGYKTFLSEFISECKIVNAIEIPEGATNGDMIKAMFPNVEVKEKNNGYEVYFGTGTAIQFFNHKWWNLPHKTESEVDEWQK